MFHKIRKLVNRIKWRFSKESCYDQMEKQGLAVLEMCQGKVGGDSTTEYLSYECIDCPYFVGFERKYWEVDTECDSCEFKDQCDLIECTSIIDTRQHFMPSMGNICKKKCEVEE